jgi:CubicO group peptidase (beta-lactamase class C family)
LVSEEIVHGFTLRFDSQASRALGWDTPSDRSSAGDYFSTSAFGHTGFTGTSIWIDPELDMFVVLLTNRVNPTRDNTKHIPLRRAVHDAAALAITDLEVPLRVR